MVEKHDVEKHDEEELSSAAATSSPLKRSYVSPRLVEYGSVAKLTQSGAGSGEDGGVVGGMMMMCL